MQVCILGNMEYWVWYSPEIIHHRHNWRIKTLLVLSPISGQIIKKGRVFVTLKWTSPSAHWPSGCSGCSWCGQFFLGQFWRYLLLFLGNKFSPVFVIYGLEIPERIPTFLILLKVCACFADLIITIKLKENCFEIDHLNSQNIFNPDLIYI